MSNGISDYKFSRDPLTIREIEVLRAISKGASNQDIADELFLSINTIKWHVRNIYEKLDVKNRTQALKKASLIGLLADQPQISIERAYHQPHNVPALLSSLLGRDQDIKEILQLLREKRLLTLTGPGGVGKTRLALEVARAFLAEEEFPGGIYLIELAPVTRPERVGPAIVEGLQLTPPPGEPAEESLARFLEERKTLLLLDNYEHLLEAAPLVSDLLVGAPNLVVLATSREALHLSGEQIFPVKPLEIDHSRQLFSQRAREVKPDFDPTKRDLDLIDQICARLDHLPLAIELAAARLPLFTLEALLDGLEDRFRVLKDPRLDVDQRHQTLWDTIDWSFNLLTLEEQILFRRLAVFQGSRTIAAVEEVCCYDLPTDPLEGLASLLAKNLVRQEEGLDGQPRFYLLETIHEFARVKLGESGEGPQIRGRHLEYFVALAEEAHLHTRGGPDQIPWLKRLKADHDNLRVTYNTAMETGEVELALRLVSCLGVFWMRMGSFAEAQRWVEESLEFAQSVPAALQARLFRVASLMYYIMKGDHELAREMLLLALDIYTELEDVWGKGLCHTGLIGISEMFPEERELALENFEKSLAYLTEVDDQIGIASAWNNLAVHYALSGDLDEALEAHGESLRIAREMGDPLRIKIQLGNLGGLNLRTGNLLAARNYYKECIQFAMEIGWDLIFSADTLIYIASTEFDLDHPYRAVVLLGAADQFYQLGAYQPQTTQLKFINELYQFSRTQLREEEYAQAWAEGQGMTPEEAVAFALEEID